MFESFTIENLSFQYSDGFQILQNIFLKAREGEIIGFLGRNGAGKSTLINIIAGSIPMDEGQVLLDNEDVSRVSEHKKARFFGRVFQDPMVGTAADMTVIENLALAYGRGRPRSLFRWSYRKEDVEFFTNELKSLGLGLEDRMYQKVGLLSGGQRQALTLLMATIRHHPSPSRIKKDYVTFSKGDKKELKLKIDTIFKNINDAYEKRKSLIQNDASLTREEKAKKIKEIKEIRRNDMLLYDLTKPILLLDEHTAALDPKTAEKVLQTTEKIVSENKLTTIMITHNMKDAIRYGNRLIMMSKGKIVADIKGEEKQKLTIESLLDMFVTNSKNDILADSMILGD